MYVAGTHSLSDVITDLSIPINRLQYTDRYKQLESIINIYPEVDKLIGHSLGGSLILEYQKRHPERNVETITYGAPVLSFKGGKRYSNYLDPISSFDFGAIKQRSKYYNPHSY